MLQFIIFNIAIPQQLKKNIKGQWATPTLSWKRQRVPQTLIRSDCAHLMTKDVYHNNQLAQTESTRLKNLSHRQVLNSWF